MDQEPIPTVDTVDSRANADRDQAVSDAQQRANRQNAKLSSGPITEAGKKRSALNALRHGAYASTSAAIPSGALAEDPTTIVEFVAGIVNALRPRDAVEYRTAEHIANLFLRIDRTARFEAATMARTGGPLICGADQGDEVTNGTSARALDNVIDRVSRLDARNGAALRAALRLFRDLQGRELDDDT